LEVSLLKTPECFDLRSGRFSSPDRVRVVQTFEVEFLTEKDIIGFDFGKDDFEQS